MVKQQIKMWIGFFSKILVEKGIEPLTPWFVATCSSPLSYTTLSHYTHCKFNLDKSQFQNFLLLTFPKKEIKKTKQSIKADEGTWTPDLLITNQLLYQLSYISTFIDYYLIFYKLCQGLKKERNQRKLKQIKKREN